MTNFFEKLVILVCSSLSPNACFADVREECSQSIEIAKVLLDKAWAHDSQQVPQQKQKKAKTLLTGFAECFIFQDKNGSYYKCQTKFMTKAESRSFFNKLSSNIERCFSGETWMHTKAKSIHYFNHDRGVGGFISIEFNINSIEEDQVVIVLSEKN